MSLDGNIFVFNPNTQASTQELNVNFELLKSCLDVLGAGVYSPGQITADQNDYATLDINGDYVGILRLDTDATRTITGLANGVNGRGLTILNVGSNNIVFTNEDVSSSASNRIITGTGASITMNPNDVLRLIYDDVSARWRVTSFSDALWG